MFGYPPNITSKTQWVALWDTLQEGSIYFEAMGGGALSGGGGGAAPYRMILDASRISSEYVTGANLQPSALQTLCCIKF